MLGDYLTALLVAVLGYIYPVYLCFKALEKHKRKPEALRGWCIYWLVMGLFTVGVQISDRFVFWVPMYCEAKVGFVVYLWHPRTQGAIYIYETFIAPFLAKHEPDIDRHLDETRTSVGDVAVRHSQSAANFVRDKFAAVLASLPQAVPQQQGAQSSGYVPRNATEAAAMAYTQAPKPRSD